MHKIGNVGIFTLLKFENKFDSETNQFNLSSKCGDKCKFVLKLVWLLSVSNLFSLYKKLYKKCQHCMRVYVNKGIPTAQLKDSPGKVSPKSNTETSVASLRDRTFSKKISKSQRKEQSSPEQLTCSLPKM